MLRKPRPLPQRFNRPVTPASRKLAQRRHERHRRKTAYRMQRMWQRFLRRWAATRKVMVRFLAVFVIGALFLLIGLLLFSPMLHIREIKVVRLGTRVDVERVQQALAPLFNEHLFFLAPQQIRDILEKEIADMESVTVVKQYPSTVEVKIELVPIIASLNIEDPQAADNAETGSGAAATGLSHFLTEDGVYVAYSPSQVQLGTGALQLRIVDWGVRPEPGSALLDPEMLAAMREAEQVLSNEYGIVVQDRAVFLRANEFHLQLAGYALWFDMRSSLDDQLQRYRLYVQSVGPDAASEYVDLRVQDKIVYK